MTDMLATDTGAQTAATPATDFTDDMGMDMDMTPQTAGTTPTAGHTNDIMTDSGPCLAVRVGAELAGSFFVCFAVYALASFGSAIFGINMAYVAVATGAAYAAVTFALSRVSEAQLNPAVTLAAVLTSRTKVLDGALYAVFQLVGALAAGALVRFLLPTSEQIASSIWFTPMVNGYDKNSVTYATIGQYGISFGISQAIAVELIASLIIVAVAMATLGSKRQAPAMGLAYGIGAGFTFPVTNAALNPARATGIAVFARDAGLQDNPLGQLWVFWLGPVLAAALVALAMIVTEMMRDAAAKRKAVASAEAAQADFMMNGAEAAEANVAADAAGYMPAQSSHDQADAQEGAQQAEPQGDADEGVERH